MTRIYDLNYSVLWYMILDVLAKFIEIMITCQIYFPLYVLYINYIYYSFHNRFSGPSGRMLFPH